MKSQPVIERNSVPQDKQDETVNTLCRASGGKIDYFEHQNIAGLTGPVVLLRVKDGYEHMPGRDLVAQTLEDFEHFLASNPHIDVMHPSNHPRDWIYSTPTIRSWAKLMPTAEALFPLQRPHIDYLPDGTEVDSVARSMFMHSHDAIGIRTRANVMAALTVRECEDFTRKHSRPMRWLSVACGAAVPVMDALQDVLAKESTTSMPLEIMLVDRDQKALDFARNLSKDAGINLPESSYMKRDIIKELLVGDGLIQEIGLGSVDFVDMLGIFEYFDDDSAARLLSQVVKMVRPGGKIVLANMLDTHPTISVNQRAVGWPLIRPRSLATVYSIIRMADLDESSIETYIPTDNVYCVMMLTK